MRWGLVVLATAVGCSAGGIRSDDGPATLGQPTTSITAGTASDSGVDGGPGMASGGGSGMVLDAGGGPGAGCSFVDMLFVVDNSESMQTYQQAMSDQFPSFVDSMFEALPPATGIHVALTTTDFDAGCGELEATANCQSASSVDDINSHYIPPTDSNNGGNGSQGRLFQWAGERWFEANSDDDPAALTTWFTGAAISAGEAGCSFEMPVAAAGFATHPANDATNNGFLHDAGALFVIFFLTDEPDKSPESKNIYRDMILDAKSACGGRDCVFVSGLVPSCTRDINQKLWQFMNEFGDDEPPWGDILDTPDYATTFGDALATAVAAACANVPVP